MSSVVKINKLISYLVGTIGSILILISFILPYANAEGLYRYVLLSDPDDMFMEELDMTNQEALSLNLVDFVRMGMADRDAKDVEDNTTTVMEISILAVLVVFIFISVLFGLALAAIMLDVIAMIIFFVLQAHFNNIGVIGILGYQLGGGYALMIVGFFLVLVGSIWFLISKTIGDNMKQEAQKIKKELKKKEGIVHNLEDENDSESKNVVVEYKCPNCSAKVLVGQKFCSDCGTKI